MKDYKVEDANWVNFWYPDFIGISYLNEEEAFVICPYFDDKEKAKYVYGKISQWNPKFTKVRFTKVRQEAVLI